MPENSSAKMSPADDDYEDAALLDLIRKRKKLPEVVLGGASGVAPGTRC